MGWTYEVTKWVEQDGEWLDLYEYRGESFIAAVLAFQRARKQSRCVGFTWRG